MWPFNHPLESQQDALTFLADYDSFLWREFAPTLPAAGPDPQDYVTRAQNRQVQSAWEDRKLEALAFWVVHLNTLLPEYEPSSLEALRMMQVTSGDEVLHAQTPHDDQAMERFMAQRHFDALKKELLKEGSVGQRLMRHMEKAFLANNPSRHGIALFLHDPQRSIEQFADPGFLARRQQDLSLKRQVTLNKTLPDSSPGPIRPRM